ncbi:ketosynthase chain-length factor [Kitasatospora sp. NPDC089509]|uniref:ketosynthase chain-length factor n=1 Tax=Kitasatospora sp. NPDC089509 TaxID=3364079 RepID=UPI0037F9D6EC
MTTAVVTGIGVAAPNGLGVERFWAATLRGESGIGPLRRFDPSGYPACLVGQIDDFVPEEHLSGRLIPQTDLMTQLALAASDWALADAELTPDTYDTDEMGVATAAAAGGFEFGQRELEALWTKGPEHVSVYMSFAWFYAVNSGQISIRHGLRGPSGVFVAEQAGGLDALAQARRTIRRGTPMVLSGGTESALNPYGWVARIAGGQVSTGEDPAGTYRPFAAGADGHVPGEGGAILVVEEDRRARDRGAPRYGEIAGYGTTLDAAPKHGGQPGLARAITIALDDAGLDASAIGVVFADGAGGATADRIEAEAIASVFGAAKVPVTVPKSMFGRLGSGGAPVDVACALLAIRDEVIPPTVGVRAADPDYGIDLVTARPRPWRPGAALVLARGVGGFNAAMVLRRAR